MSENKQIKINQDAFTSSYQRISQSASGLKDKFQSADISLTEAETLEKYIDIFEQMKEMMKSYFALAEKDIQTIREIGETLKETDEELSKKLQ